MLKIVSKLGAITLLTWALFVFGDVTVKAYNSCATEEDFCETTGGDFVITGCYPEYGICYYTCYYPTVQSHYVCEP